MALESMPPMEYEPQIQFFKTEDIVILAIICIVSLLFTILWLIALMRYIHSIGIPPFRPDKNQNNTTEHAKAEISQSIDNQRC